MTDFLYCELITMCLCILAFVFAFERRRLSSCADKNIKFSMIAVCAVYLCSDLIWYLLSSHYIARFFWAVYIFKMLFFISRIVFVYLWYLVSELNYNVNVLDRPYKIWISLIPVAISVIITLFTPFKNILFSISKDGVYSRGSHYNLLFIIFMIYLLVIQYRCGFRMYAKKYYAERQKYIAVFLFCLPLFICGIIQYIFTGMPVVGIGMVLGLLQMQLSTQNELITIDELTGLNNRTQMLKYLENKMHVYDNSGTTSNSLFLFVIDVDDFKSINDTYGHVVGDEALKTVATCLKRICGRYNCFGCRFGGDEFIIIGELYDFAAAEAISVEINKEIQMENFVQGNFFKLQVSIGYAQKDFTVNTIPDFIDKADKMLYIVKRNKKAN